jgi:hypothetical protein
MRRAARRDDGESEIVSALREAGAVVRVITQGDGIPDLLVGYTSPATGNSYTILMEVKDGTKPPSKRALTPAEEQFFMEWTGGMLVIVNSVGEALDVLASCV